MSGQVELWQWRYTDDFGKRRVFPCRLSEEDGRRLRDVERIEGSLEIRRPLGATSDWQKSLLASALDVVAFSFLSEAPVDSPTESES